MYVIIFLVFFVLNLSNTRELSCIERDYCNGTITNDRSMSDGEKIRERNCFCDESCFQYDDCCEDIKHYQIKEPIQATCVDYTYPMRILSELYSQTVMPIWMVTTCLSNYQYTQLEKNCTYSSENDSYISNPPAYIPMTSKQTNLTYRNIYCAQCNNEKIESLIDWPLQIFCNDFTQNSTFNYKDELDIIKLQPKEGQRYTSRLSFPPPPAVVHPCKQHTINSCPRYI